MLEFGSAQVRLELDTSDYDKSIKALRSDQQCLDICAELDTQKLQGQVEKLDLSCLDLCVELDRKKIQKSLTQAQKNLKLKLDTDLEVSTKTKIQKEPKPQVEAGLPKDFGQQLHILTAQIKNARDLNISTVAFDVVNSLKNLNFQIFKTEQALLDLQAPTFDAPEIPDLNQSVEGTKEVISKIHSEFAGLFSGVADLNQRIRSQRLPDLLAAAPQVEASELNINGVVQSVLQFGQVVESADASLGAGFLDLRDTFIKLSTTIDSNSFAENLEKASNQLSDFWKSADLADPEAVSAFEDVGKELRRFERGLKDAGSGPPQTEIGESFGRLSQEVNRAAIALMEMHQKTSQVQPPDLSGFSETAFASLKEEVARTAQIFGLANIETSALGDAVGLARQKLEQLQKIDIKEVALDATPLQEQISLVSSALSELRLQLEGASSGGGLALREDADRIAGTVQRLHNSFDLVEEATTQFVRSVLVLGHQQEKLVDSVTALADGARATGAILSITGPAIQGVATSIVGLDDQLVPALRALAANLPLIAGNFEELGSFARNATASLIVLSERAEQINLKQVITEGLKGLSFDANMLMGMFDPLERAIANFAANLSSLVFAAPMASSAPLGQALVDSPEIAQEMAMPKVEVDPQIEEPIKVDVEPKIDPPPKVDVEPKIEAPPELEIEVELDQAQPIPVDVDLPDPAKSKIKEAISDRVSEIENTRNKELVDQIVSLEQRPSSESIAQIQSSMEALQRSGLESLVNSINNNFLRLILAGRKTISESFDQELLEGYNQRNLANEVLHSSLIADSAEEGASNRTIKKANKRSEKVFKAALGDERFAESTGAGLTELLNRVQGDFDKFFEGALSEEDLVRGLEAIFTPKAAEAFKDAARENLKVDLSDFIGFDQIEPIIAEYKKLTKEVISESEALASQGVFDQTTLDNLNAATQQLRTIKTLTENIRTNPTLDNDQRRSLVGSNLYLSNQQARISEQIAPAFSLAQGIVPEIGQLEGLLDRVRGGLFDDADKAGNEVIAGLRKGIIDGLALIDDAGSDAANELLESLRTTLGISSPAKRVIELMRFVVMAIPIGLAKGQKMVRQSMTDLIDVDGLKAQSQRKAPGPAAKSGSGFLSALGNQLKDLQNKFPILGRFKEIFRDLAFGVGAFIGATTIGDLIVTQFGDAIRAAKTLETQIKSLTISVGGTVAALSELENVKGFATNISADLLNARESFKKLAAVTRGTNLEGDQTREIFEGLTTATTALQLPTEQAERAFLAVGQVISKNRVQSEELRRQLAEALPGAIGIFARSLGVPITEIDKLVESGKLGADTMVDFARQLKLEFGAGVEEAANSLQGAENRLQNSVTLLKEQFGASVLPIATNALNLFSSALQLVGENSQLLGSVLSSTLAVSLFNLNARFKLIQRSAILFQRLIGRDLRLKIKATNAELAATGGGVAGFGKKLSILGKSAAPAIKSLGGFALQTAAVSLAIAAAGFAFEQFKTDPLVEQLQKGRKELKRFEEAAKEVKGTVSNASKTDLGGAAQDTLAASAALLTLDLKKVDELARTAKAKAIGTEDDLFGRSFLGPLGFSTLEQKSREERVIEFGSLENQKQLGEAISIARQQIADAAETGKTLDIDDASLSLKRLGIQIKFLKDLKVSDERGFIAVGGPRELANLEKIKDELLESTAAGSGFRDKLRDIKSELEEIENSKVTADVELAENIAAQTKAGNFDTEALEIEAGRGLNAALQQQVAKQKELLEAEKARLADPELQKRLNDPVQQTAALEEQKQIQETIGQIEKEHLSSRKELANQTTDLLKKERERRLNAIDLLQKEQELSGARERNNRIRGAQETVFTADLDERDNKTAIETARKRLEEISANGSESELIDAERSLTDAIAAEENRKLEIRQQARENTISQNKLHLQTESLQLEQALQNRLITQADYDRQQSVLRQKEIQKNIAETKDAQARLQADFALAPDTEGNRVQFRSQSLALSDQLVEEQKALASEVASARVAEEERYLEKSRKISDQIISQDQLKADMMIRNLEQVGGQSDALLRSLDQQEQSLQSQFDLINAQQSRAVQRFDIQIGRNEDAETVLGLLDEEKERRQQISDLRRERFLPGADRGQIDTDLEDLEAQKLSLTQRQELERQLKETTGSTLTSEADLIKARISLEENATRQRAEALAAELEQERALLKITIQRDQIAAQAASRDAQVSLIQSQVQQTEQRQNALGIERELQIAEANNDPEQVALLQSQLAVAQEAVKLTQQQIGLQGGVLRDSQLAEQQVAKLSEQALQALEVSQNAQVSGFLADEESQRRQFNLNQIQSGREEFIGGRGVRGASDRLSKFSGSGGAELVGSSAAVNQALKSSALTAKTQESAILMLDTTVRKVGDFIVQAIERNAVKLPKQGPNRERKTQEDSFIESQLKEVGL